MDRIKNCCIVLFHHEDHEVHEDISTQNFVFFVNFVVLTLKHFRFIILEIKEKR